VVENKHMEDQKLMRMGRGSRRGRHQPSIPDPRPSQLMDIPRRNRGKRVSFAPDTKGSGDTFMGRLRANPVYIPVVFVSLGGVLGACTFKYFYTTKKPSDPEEKVACQKDEREQAFMSSVAGGVVGLVVYWFMFSKAAVEEDFDDWSDGLDDGF